MKSGVVVFVGNPLKRNRGPINEKIDKIVGVIENYYCVDAYELSRKRDVVFARQVAMYFLRKKAKLKVEAIGHLFGRDHSSVIYATKQIEGFYLHDPVIKNQIDELSKRMA